MLFFAPQFTYYRPLDLAQLYVEITERKGVKYINKKSSTFKYTNTNPVARLGVLKYENWRQKAAKAFTDCLGAKSEFFRQIAHPFCGNLLQSTVQPQQGVPKKATSISYVNEN